VLEYRRGSNLFATGLELPRSEGREAGLVINEERPLMIRMGERDYPVPGVDVNQMEAFLYVLGSFTTPLERAALGTASASLVMSF
jgi:hypothetical protein